MYQQLGVNMNIQKSIRRILKEETEVPSFIRRRVRLDYIEETFHDVVEVTVKKFKRKSTGYNGLTNFKVHVVVRVVEELMPYLERHQDLNDINQTTELINKFSKFLFDYYGKDLEEIYKGEIEPETNINESKKIVRRFPFKEMEQVFKEALETVSEKLIDSIQQNDTMSYLDFRESVFFLMLNDIWNNHKELYKVYNEDEFDVTYFMYKLYGDTIFKRYMDLSKVKREDKINESTNKKDYAKILKTLVQPYYDYDGVCDIRVEYDKEEDMYGIYIVFSEEELNDIYKGELQHHLNNVSHIRRGIYNDVDNYLPIYNVYVGTYQEPNCNTINNINESENKKVNLAKQLIHQLFDEVQFIKQSTYNGKPLLEVYIETDDSAANIESWITHNICDTIEEYTGGSVKVAPSWGSPLRRKVTDADVLIDCIVIKYDNLGNVIN